MKNKDWTGNKQTTFAMLGASNHTDHDRAERDYYATEPKAVEELLKVETFKGSIWENCCGEGHLSKPMIKAGYAVVSTDLIDRGYGQGGIDFFECDKTLADNIITNPPYSAALEWVEHSLNLLENGKNLRCFFQSSFWRAKGERNYLKQGHP